VAADRAADEDLVVTRSVNIGGIDEGHAEIEGPMDRRD